MTVAEAPRLEAIIRRGEALGKALAAWGQTHRNRPLAEVEQAVLGLVRAALPELLALVVEASVTSQDPDRTGWWSRACPTCGQPSELKDWVKRTVKTLCGPISFARPWCRCARCRQGWSPTDRTLGLGPKQRLSAGLHEQAAFLGATCASFDDARQVLQRLTGLTLSKETTRQHTNQVGAALEGKQQAAQVQVARTQNAAEPVEVPPGRLTLEIDGTMVRYREEAERDPQTGRRRYRVSWHEVKQAVVAGCEVRAMARAGRIVQAPTLVAPSYVAAREPAAAFGRRVVAEAARRGALDIVGWTGPRLGRGRALLRELLVLADGALWIWELADTHFGRRLEILDFYHATEYLARAAAAAFGEGTAPAHAWFVAQRHTLRHEGPTPVRHALGQLRGPTLAAQATLREVRTYFRNQQARMDYPAYAAQGLPLGSGAAESAGGHLVQDRLKRPGAQWSPAGAQHVLAVRCAVKSGRPLAA